MKLKKVLVFMLISMLCLSALSGCGNKETADDSDAKEEVKFGVVNWSEGIAMTNLAKVILEEEMGYDVEITVADAAPIFSAVAKGDYDVFMDTWLPVTHETYMLKYGDKLEILGTNFEGAKIGLVVPEYVECNSIEEMNDFTDKFEGKIVGVDAGAGIMKATNKAIEEYGLDYELMASSGPMMTAALKKAADGGDWVAVTGWSPHWKFAKWDLKFLEDPKGIYGAEEHVDTIARAGFKADMPEVAEFLENFYMTESELGGLMGAIVDGGDKEPEEVAREWKNANMELVKTWIPQK